MRLFAPLILIACFATALYFLKDVTPEQPRKHKAHDHEKINTLNIEAITVEKRAFAPTIKAFGYVAAKQRSQLSSEISGRIEYIDPRFSEGYTFEKGTLLVRLDSATHRADLAIRLAEWAQAEAALNEERARAEQAQSDWVRLHGKQPAPDLALRKPQLASAKANLQAAQARVDKAKAELTKTEVRAPYHGVVIQRNSEVGELASPSMPLGEIIGIDRYRVKLPISAQEASLIGFTPSSTHIGTQTAQTVTLSKVGTHTATHTNSMTATQVVQAELMALTDIVDPNTQQRHAIIEYTPTHLEAPPFIAGDYVEATFRATPLTSVFVLPADAVYQNRYVNTVLQHAEQPSTLERRPVAVLWQDSDVALIREGLNNGDQVITTPLNNVISGTPISVINKRTDDNDDKDAVE